MSDARAAETLTVRQRQVLAFIRTHVAERGYPPSIREIGAAVGMSSSNSVAYQLRELERKGFIQREVDRSRAITLTDAVIRAGSDACPACGTTIARSESADGN